MRARVVPLPARSRVRRARRRRGKQFVFYKSERVGHASSSSSSDDALPNKGAVVCATSSRVAVSAAARPSYAARHSSSLARQYAGAHQHHSNSQNAPSRSQHGSAMPSTQPRSSAQTYAPPSAAYATTALNATTSAARSAARPAPPFANVDGGGGGGGGFGGIGGASGGVGGLGAPGATDPTTPRKSISATARAPHGKILFRHFIVTVNSVQDPSFGAPSSAHRSLVSLTSQNFPSYLSVSAAFCVVSRVAYASHPTALHAASPPYVVGPSADLSRVDALNVTVSPVGSVASPARIVNVSTHDALGEQTIRHRNDAWHFDASSTVARALAHENRGGAHDDASAAPAVVATRATSATATSAAVDRARGITRARGAMTTATRVARVARAGRAGADARRTTATRVARRTTRRATRGDDDGDGADDARDGRFYAYDARTWRAFEDAFGRWPAEAWFAPLQASIAIALAGVVDAGYSGDWSRVGALTTEQEAWTRRFVAFVAVAHGVVGAIARDVALKRGADATSANAAFAKTFVVGFVGLVEAAFGGDDEDA